MRRPIYNIVMPLLIALHDYAQVVTRIVGRSLDVSIAPPEPVTLLAEDRSPQVRGLMRTALAPSYTGSGVVGVTAREMRSSRCERKASIMPRRRLLNRHLIAALPDPISFKSSKALQRERRRMINAVLGAS